MYREKIILEAIKNEPVVNIRFPFLLFMNRWESIFSRFTSTLLLVSVIIFGVAPFSSNTIPGTVAYSDSISRNTVDNLPKSDSIKKTPLLKAAQSNAKSKNVLTKTVSTKKSTAPKSNQKSRGIISAFVFRIAEHVPQILKKPVRIAGHVISFTKNNTGKIVFLTVSIVLILSAAMFFKQRAEKDHFMTTTRLSVMDKEIQRACRYIENNYFDVDLTVDSLCTLMVTGKAFLTVLFEKELGMTVEDFIVQVRVNRVKILLDKDSAVDIDTLALKTGFGGIGELKKAFTTMCGVTIEDYRQSLTTA